MHIGHRKTGSSYIQSSLARSAEALADVGFRYPEGRYRELASQGMITAGNAGSILRKRSRQRPDAERAMVLSGETLFRRLLDEDVRAQFAELRENIGARRTNILLFIRNPVEHAASSYQQSIKRNGNTGSMESWYRDEYDDPHVAAELLEVFANNPDVNLTILNYSVCKNDLMECVAQWLQVPAEVFEHPPIETVNRSMTHTELELQRVLNRKLGKSGRLLSDKLCNELPDIRPDELYPPVAIQQVMLDRLETAMDRVDEFVPAGHRYSREIRVDSSEPVEGPMTIEPRQIAVIGESLGNEISRLEQSKTAEETTSAIESANKKMSEIHRQTGSVNEKLDELSATVAALKKQVRQMNRSPWARLKSRIARKMRG